METEKEKEQEQAVKKRDRKISKQYPEIKKRFIEKNKDIKKLFAIAGLSIESIEIFTSQAKALGMSNREYFENTFK